MALIPLDVAKTQLNIPADDDTNNVDIYAKAQQAEAIILSRCNSTAANRVIVATWTADTLPLTVQTAMLLMLTHLYEHRGDDPQTDAALWESVDRLLVTNRTPGAA